MLTFFIEKDSFRTESHVKFSEYLPESKSVALATGKIVVFSLKFLLKRRQEKREKILGEVRARAALLAHSDYLRGRIFFRIPEQFFVTQRDNYQTREDNLGFFPDFLFKRYVYIEFLRVIWIGVMPDCRI